MRRRDKAAPSGSAQHHGWIAGSCGDWLEARRTHSAIALEAWMIGYVTGFNITCVSAPEPLKLSGMAGNSVYAWTDRQCAEYPLESLDEAANALLHVRGLAPSACGAK